MATGLDRLRARASKALSPLSAVLRTHGWSYWALALAVILVSMLAAPQLETYLPISKVRNWLFQHLSDSAFNPAEPQNVKLLIIEDDQYWFGDLHHRSPVDRRYLAKLVKLLDTSGINPLLIALDFDVRLPDPGLPGTPGDFSQIDETYRAETDDLVHAIEAAAAHGRRVVLAHTIARSEQDGLFELEPDTYQPYGLCARPRSDGTWVNQEVPDFSLDHTAERNISCGYIALPFETRQFPPIVSLKDGGQIDSFALAIVRTQNPRLANQIGTGTFYTTYIPDDVWADPTVVVSASRLLAGDPEVRQTLSGKIVIIGAGWHDRAAGRGMQVDLHDTPIGPISGALIHANFVEAALAHRHFSVAPAWLLHVFEILFSAFAAVLFAAYTPLWAKMATLVGLFAFLIAIQWVTLHLFSAFLEAFVPMFGVALHSIGHRLLVG